MLFKKNFKKKAKKNFKFLIFKFFLKKFGKIHIKIKFTILT